MLPVSHAALWPGRIAETDSLCKVADEEWDEERANESLLHNRGLAAEHREQRKRVHR